VHRRFKLLVTFQEISGQSALIKAAVDHQYLELVKATSRRKRSKMEQAKRFHARSETVMFTLYHTFTLKRLPTHM